MKVFRELLALSMGCLSLGVPTMDDVRSATLDKPKVPLSSSSRWILGTDGQRVKLRCINWAGHLEANVPEGLHKQPIDYVADWIAKQGFNCVRLTYSIDMALNPTLKVSDSFKAAAGVTGVAEADMMSLYDKAVEKNPFLKDASVLDAFDQVQSALWDQGIMTVLDNHVSRASWCCNLTDGNGWWSDAQIYLADNSRYFDTQKWQDGLQAMAQWTKGRQGIVGMSLRNELRASWTQIAFAPSTWLEYMPRAGNLIHEANPDLLIMVGGINGGTDLSPLRTNTMNLGEWANKRVWEAHVYSFTVITPSLGSCDVLKTEYGGLFGFVLEQGNDSTGPLWLSEFGVGMTGGPHDGLSDADYNYLSCLVPYMENNDADWSLWAVQGSYYVREGAFDSDESFGALDFNWTDWRNPKFKGMLGKMPDVTQGP